jgi:hypothetical protein
LIADFEASRRASASLRTAAGSCVTSAEGAPPFASVAGVAPDVPRARSSAFTSLVEITGVTAIFVSGRRSRDATTCAICARPGAVGSAVPGSNAIGVTSIRSMRESWLMCSYWQCEARLRYFQPPPGGRSLQARR